MTMPGRANHGSGAARGAAGRGDAGARGAAGRGDAAPGGPATDVAGGAARARASAGDDVVACPLCGAYYREEDGRSCRVRCPLERGCRLLRCPECGYEVPAPSRLTRALARWFGGAGRSA